MNDEPKQEILVPEKEKRPVGRAIVSNEDRVVSTILALAKDKDVDVAKMRELVELSNSMSDRNAKREFHAAMSAAQQEMKPVVRTAENSQTSSKYALLEKIDQMITPIITKHGFSTSFDTADSPKENHYRIICVLAHNGGHERTYHADIPIDAAGIKGNTNKTPTHAFGSTMTYGRRYLKVMIFDISITSEDDDGNAAGNEMLTDEQIEDIEKRLTAHRINYDRFLVLLKVPALGAVFAKKYPEVLKLIDNIVIDRAAKAKENG